MEKEKKFELINNDLEVFYIPCNRIDADLYEIRAISKQHAIQKFNYILAEGKPHLNPCRRVSLIERQSNIAYKTGEVPNALEIFNRAIDFYDIYDREIISPPNLKLIH